MADPANVLKMLQSLGGMASESYGGPTKGGQPLLPKPMLSQPDLLSPYAPGLNSGMNSGTNQKPSRMGDSDHHPANQLAQYLTMNGRSARRQYTDAGDFMRGAAVPGFRG